jgi:hypothetical protein
MLPSLSWLNVKRRWRRNLLIAIRQAIATVRIAILLTLLQAIPTRTLPIPDLDLDLLPDDDGHLPPEDALHPLDVLMAETTDVCPGRLLLEDDTRIADLLLGDPQGTIALLLADDTTMIGVRPGGGMMTTVVTKGTWKGNGLIVDRLPLGEGTMTTRPLLLGEGRQ